MSILGKEIKQQMHRLLRETCDAINNNDVQQFKKITSANANAGKMLEEIKTIITDYCYNIEAPPYIIAPPPVDVLFKKYDVPNDECPIAIFFIDGNEDKINDEDDDWVVDDVDYDGGKWNIECSLIVNGQTSNLTLITNLNYINNEVMLEYKLIEVM